jgi:hypothetical protein
LSKECDTLDASVKKHKSNAYSLRSFRIGRN